MNLKFLNNPDFKLETVEKAVTRSINLQPENGGDIRIHRNGKIVYSDEFRAKVGEGGLDFIDSRQWSLYPKNAQEHLIFLCIVSDLTAKHSAKVDVRKESVNSPSTAVKNHLIPLMRDLYTLNPDFNSVELKVNYDFPVTNEEGVYNIPKVVSSGSAKGENTYTRRENVTFYPVTLVKNAEITEDIPVDPFTVAEDDIIVNDNSEAIQD